MSSSPRTRRLRAAWGAAGPVAPESIAPAVVAAGVAVAAMTVSAHVLALSPLLLALLAGAVVANTPAARHRVVAEQAAVTKLMLRLGVALLGLHVVTADLASVGVQGAVVVLATVVATYAGTTWLGRRLGLDHDFVTLVAAGFSICGAAAIAGVTDAVRARERHVAIAVALVTVFGSVMIIAIPAAGHGLGLTADQTSVWAGASIHEVAQVAAAASLISGGAVALAMTIKLGRVLMLAPVCVVAGRGTPGRTRLVPGFVVGFVLAVAARSTGLLPDAALEVTDLATTALLAAGMFGLGLGIRVAELWPVTVRAVVLATAATTIAAGTSLTLVAVLL